MTFFKALPLNKFPFQNFQNIKKLDLIWFFSKHIATTNPFFRHQKSGFFKFLSNLGEKFDRNLVFSGNKRYGNRLAGGTAGRDPDSAQGFRFGGSRRFGWLRRLSTGGKESCDRTRNILFCNT